MSSVTILGNMADLNMDHEQQEIKVEIDMAVDPFFRPKCKPRSHGK